MPQELPHAPEAARQLSRREGDAEPGYDTAVAKFFGAEVVDEDDVPTVIDTADLGRTARDRAQERARSRPTKLNFR